MKFNNIRDGKEVVTVEIKTNCLGSEITNHLSIYLPSKDDGLIVYASDYRGNRSNSGNLIHTPIYDNMYVIRKIGGAKCDGLKLVGGEVQIL